MRCTDLLSVRPVRLAALPLGMLLARALPAGAGIVSTSPFGYTTQYGGSFVAGSASNGDIALTPSSLTSTLRGDVSYVLPYPSTNPGRWATTSLALFTVGVIPIEITGLDYAMNYKLVLGNGDTFSPLLSCMTDYYIQQAVDPLNPNPNTDPIFFGNGFARYQQGNGYNVIDETFSNFSNVPVLGAGLTYYLRMTVDTGITNFMGYNGYHQLSTTLEFGGAYSAGTYDGFSFTMNYREVPGPGGTAVLGLVGIGAARRRR